MNLKQYVNENRADIIAHVREVYEYDIENSSTALSNAVLDDDLLFYNACKAGITNITLSGYPSITDKTYLNELDYFDEN